MVHCMYQDDLGGVVDMKRKMIEGVQGSEKDSKQGSFVR